MAACICRSRRAGRIRNLLRRQASMDEKYLIKNTTREQREKIIRDALSCNGVSCEECSACDAYGAVNPLEMYQPYIDGKKEIQEINREYVANYLK